MPTYETSPSKSKLPPQKIPLPQAQGSTKSKVNVHQININRSNPVELGVNQYMTPNTIATQRHEQIDTSVVPVNDHFPITYTTKNLHDFKQQLEMDNFDQQRYYQKQSCKCKMKLNDSDSNSEAIREQLLFEKSHHMDMDQTMEDDYQKIQRLNHINQEMTQKLKDLQTQYNRMENMYLLADSQKNTYEVRLRNIRSSVDEDAHAKGYTYLPPTHWTMNQWRPPICLRQLGDPECLTSSPTAGSYADVFNQTQVQDTDASPHIDPTFDPIDSTLKST